MMTKKKLIKDLKKIIRMVWDIDPPTENPYNWEVLGILQKHLEELKKTKTDEEALALANKFKEKYSDMINSLIKHLNLKKLIT
jgi:hypothetical protein